MKAFFILLFLSITSAGNACSCLSGNESYDKAYKRYGLIVIGKVIKVEIKESFERAYTVIVKEWFKGKKTDKFIIINTPFPGGGCGVYAERGQWLLFFGYSFEGNYGTDICTPTRNYKARDKEIIFLRNKAKLYYR